MSTRTAYSEQLSLFPEPPPPPPSPVQRERCGGRAAAVLFEREEMVDLEAHLGRLAGVPVQVRYTENRTILISLPRGVPGPALRVHRCFRRVPARVAEAIHLLYLAQPRPARRQPLAHQVSLWHQAAASPPPSPLPEALDHGLHHDLRGVLARVLESHFDPAPALDITFGPRALRRRLAHHERHDPRNLVIVNPVLDHPEVAPWYLDFLVFHEVLHEVVPPRAIAGRLWTHPPEFQIRERAHPEHQRARGYEQHLLGRGWARLAQAYQRRRRAPKAAAPARSTQIERRQRTGRRGAGGGEP